MVYNVPMVYRVLELFKLSVFWLNENTIKNGNSTKFHTSSKELLVAGIFQFKFQVYKANTFFQTMVQFLLFVQNQYFHKYILL
jgi:hypothetical protein